VPGRRDGERRKAGLNGPSGCGSRSKGLPADGISGRLATEFCQLDQHFFELPGQARTPRHALQPEGPKAGLIPSHGGRVACFQCLLQRDEQSQCLRFDAVFGLGQCCQSIDEVLDVWDEFVHLRSIFHCAILCNTPGPGLSNGIQLESLVSVHLACFADTALLWMAGRRRTATPAQKRYNTSVKMLSSAFVVLPHRESNFMNQEVTR